MITKHLSSSTADLLILFEAEKNIISALQTNFSTFKHETIVAYLKSVDFDENQDPAEYVYHPINAFHMLQRTTKWLPKLKKLLPEINFEFRSSNLSILKTDFIMHVQEPRKDGWYLWFFEARVPWVPHFWKYGSNEYKIS